MTHRSGQNPDDRLFRLHWRVTVALLDLPSTTKTVAQAIALRFQGSGDAAWPSPERIGTDARLDVSRVYGHLKKIVGAGMLERTVNASRRARSADLRPVLSASQRKEAGRWLRSLWSSSDAETRALKAIPQAYVLDSKNQSYLRMLWERGVREDLSVNRSAFGAALGLSLLVDSQGRPYRNTTVAELTEVTGLGRTTLTKGLKNLNELRWIQSEHRRGWEGGIEFRLRFPSEGVLDRLAGKYIREHVEGDFISEDERSMSPYEQALTYLDELGDQHDPVRVQLSKILTTPKHRDTLPVWFETLPGNRGELELIAEAIAAHEEVSGVSVAHMRINDPALVVRGVLDVRLTGDDLRTYLRCVVGDGTKSFAGAFHPQVVARMKDDVRVRGAFWRKKHGSANTADDNLLDGLEIHGSGVDDSAASDVFDGVEIYE